MEGEKTFKTFLLSLSVHRHMWNGINEFIVHIVHEFPCWEVLVDIYLYKAIQLYVIVLVHVNRGMNGFYGMRKPGYL